MGVKGAWAGDMKYEEKRDLLRKMGCTCRKITLRCIGGKTNTKEVCQGRGPVDVSRGLLTEGKQRLSEEERRRGVAKESPWGVT